MSKKCLWVLLLIWGFSLADDGIIINPQPERPYIPEPVPALCRLFLKFPKCQEGIVEVFDTWTPYVGNKNLKVGSINVNCNCLAMIFSTENFNGKYKVIELKKNEEVKLPFIGKSLMVTCSDGRKLFYKR